MTYKTHLSTGLLFSSAYFLLLKNTDLNPWIILALIISTAIGSSAPDLDTPTGELWDKIPAGSIISRLFNPIFIGGHRHLSHSLLGLGLFSILFKILIATIPYSFYGLNHDLLLIAFIIGFLSHLLADMFTEAGVPILFPLGYHFGIPPNPFQKVRIKTGQWFENLIIYPIVNLALLYVIYQYIVHQN